MVIEDPGHMAVTIITTDIVHALLISTIAALDVIVELSVLLGIDIKDNVFVTLSEGKIVFRYVVGSCEVVNDSIGAGDASVTDHR